MRIRYLIILMLICFSYFNFANAQAPDTMWTRTYGGTGQDSCWSAQYTSDHGFILAGWTNSFGAGNRDIYIVKTDSLGDTIWTRTYGGVDNDDAWGVLQTFDGGYVVGGYTHSYGPGGDVWLIKTDAQGDTQWTKTVGGTGWDGCRGLYQTSDSGFILIGNTNSYGAGGVDIYLIRMNKNGDTLWTKTFGDSLNDNGYAVTQISDGGFLIAAWTESFGAGSYDAYIIKTDSIGDSIWSFVWGGANLDKACAVIEASDGSYMIAGWTYSFGPEILNAFLMKMTTTGDMVWTKYYGNGNYSCTYSVQETSDGGYILAGSVTDFFPYDMYLLKTDSLGEKIWDARYGGNMDDNGWSAGQTADNGYFIAGWTGSFGAGGADFYLVKTGSEMKVDDDAIMSVQAQYISATIISDAIRLPREKKYRIYDVAGRLVQPLNISPGIYFIEIEGKIAGKIIKVR